MNRRSLMTGLLTGLLATFLASGLTSAAIAADPIKIGVVAHKTGPLAGGEAVTHTPNIIMWAKQINDRGGLKVGGTWRPVEIIEYDDKTNPAEHI